MQSDTITLDASIFYHMSIGKTFKNSESQIVGLEFSDDGTILAAYSDHALHLYDTTNGKKIKTLYNNISKISQLRFTHNPTSVLFIPQEEPHDILYWSIFENEIIKSFKGPSDAKITSLHINPTNDDFMVLDDLNILRVYNLNSNYQEHKISVVQENEIESLVVCFDSSGKNYYEAIYGMFKGRIASVVNLCEVNNNGQRILNSFLLKDSPKVIQIKADFHAKLIGCQSDKNSLFLISANLNKMMYQIALFPTSGNVYPELAFTPDSRFIINGGVDGSLRIYELEKGSEVAKYSSHVKPCLCVKFSPGSVLLASACQNIILWVPKLWDQI